MTLSQAPTTAVVAAIREQHAQFTAEKVAIDEKIALGFVRASEAGLNAATIARECGENASWVRGMLDWGLKLVTADPSRRTWTADDVAYEYAPLPASATPEDWLELLAELSKAKAYAKENVGYRHGYFLAISDARSAGIPSAAIAKAIDRSPARIKFFCEVATRIRSWPERQRLRAEEQERLIAAQQTSAKPSAQTVPNG